MSKSLHLRKNFYQHLRLTTSFTRPTAVFLGFLFLLGALWRLGLGSLYLFDWDEINFAEIAREMQISGNYGQPTINFLPFHEKPPLFSWLQSCAMQLTDNLDLAARLPNLFCGLLSLLIIYRIGRRIHSQRLAYVWAAFMGLSLLPSLYFRSGIIDPWFNLFLLLAAVRIISWEQAKKPKIGALVEAGLWLGLAIMTKGPAGGLIIALFIGVQLSRSRFRSWPSYIITGFVALLPITLWLLWLWPQDNGFFTREFLAYQWRLFSQPDAGHGGFPGYHLFVLLLGCFPASVFALPALFRRTPTGIGQAVYYDRRFRDLFWVVLILFSIVTTKIVHYSSLCYFPLTYLSARCFLAWEQGKWQPSRLWWRLLIGIWLIFSIAAVLLPLGGQTLASWSTALGLDFRRWVSIPVSWPWTTYLPSLVAIGLLVALWFLSKRTAALATAKVSLLGTALFLYLGLAFWAPRIQQYSQGPLIEFYQSHIGKFVYLGTAYHKSYAHLYYSRLTMAQGGKDRDWCFHGPIDTDFYFSSPIRRRDQILQDVPDAELLYERGNYAFFRRAAAIENR